MKLTGHDLKQINDTTLEHLSPDQLLSFSKRMLADLREDNDLLHLKDEQPGSTPETLDLCGTQSSPQEGVDDSSTPKTSPVKGTAGKQPGAKGFGRTQRLPVTAISHHASTHCTVCNASVGTIDQTIREAGRSVITIN